MLFISGFIFSQSDEILDKLYEMENAQTSYAALVVLQAAGHLTFDATVDDALAYLDGQKWGKAVLKDGEEISKGSFSLLVMEAFDLPHGLMYNFLPIKRYALKEMVYNGYILGNPYPNDPISSFDVVYVLASIPVDEDINKNYVEPEEEATMDAEPEVVVTESSVIEGATTTEGLSEVAIEPAAEIIPEVFVEPNTEAIPEVPIEPAAEVIPEVDIEPAAEALPEVVVEPTTETAEPETNVTEEVTEP